MLFIGICFLLLSYLSLSYNYKHYVVYNSMADFSKINWSILNIICSYIIILLSTTKLYILYIRS